MANSVCLGHMEDNKIICSDSHRHIFHVYCACTRARDDDFDEDQWMTSALVARWSSWLLEIYSTYLGYVIYHRNVQYDTVNQSSKSARLARIYDCLEPLPKTNSGNTRTQQKNLEHGHVKVWKHDFPYTPLFGRARGVSTSHSWKRKRNGFCSICMLLAVTYSNTAILLSCGDFKVFA